MALTRDEILNLKDLEVKLIEVPSWKDAEVYIKPLTRGQQDVFLKRRYSHIQVTMKSGKSQGSTQEAEIYGHDAYLCACAICDEHGSALFSMSDISELEKKNGQAIGEIAQEIVDYSGMAVENKELDDLEDEEQAELERAKN